MRIVTWNCCRGPFAAKTAFARELAPDVAVLQECARRGEESPAARWAGENPAQGIAVLAGDGYAVEPIDPVPEAPRWIVPFRVTGPRGFTLLAVWTLSQPTYTATLCRRIEIYR